MEILGFEFRVIHVLGPVVATVAMFFVGRNMVRKEKGRSIRVGPTLILFFSALAFHIFFTEGTFLDRVSIVMLDFGIAMLIDSGYLAYHKVHPKVFWGLGMVLVITAGIMYLLSWLFGVVWGGFSTDDSLGENQILVEIGNDDKIQELEGILAEYDATWEVAYPMVDDAEDLDLSHTYLITVPDEDDVEDLIEDLVEDVENVDSAEPNTDVSIEPVEADQEEESNGKYMTNDPQIRGQWWLKPNEINDIHRKLAGTKPRKKAKVAIVDTGVDAKHEDIKGVWRTSPGKTDGNGHGSHCAGLAGAATNNGKGIASLNWEGKFVEVTGYHALDKNGRGTTRSVSQAIIKAAEDGADVISLSLGGDSPKPPRSQVKAIEYAMSHGAIVVAAAGNSNRDAKLHSPSNIKGVIVVSAVDRNHKKAKFSNTNTSLGRPISAPGVDILSLKNGGGYTRKSGTSMATPIVAGLLGILRSLDPSMDSAEAYKLLHDTGIKIKDREKVGRMIHIKRAIDAKLN